MRPKPTKFAASIKEEEDNIKVVHIAISLNVPYTELLLFEACVAMVTFNATF